MAVESKAYRTPFFFMIFPLLFSSLSQPPLHLTASSSSPCIYCTGERTTEVQRRVRGGCVTFTLLLPPTSPCPEMPRLHVWLFTVKMKLTSVPRYIQLTNTGCCNNNIRINFQLWKHDVIAWTYKADVGLRDDVWEWNYVFVSRQVARIIYSTFCTQTGRENWLILFDKLKDSTQMCIQYWILSSKNHMTYFNCGPYF